MNLFMALRQHAGTPVWRRMAWALRLRREDRMRLEFAKRFRAAGEPRRIHTARAVFSSGRYIRLNGWEGSLPARLFQGFLVDTPETECGFINLFCFGLLGVPQVGAPAVGCQLLRMVAWAGVGSSFLLMALWEMNWLSIWAILPFLLPESFQLHDLNKLPLHNEGDLSVLASFREIPALSWRYPGSRRSQPVVDSLPGFVPCFTGSSRPARDW